VKRSPLRLVKLPTPDVCVVCGTPVVRGHVMDCGDCVSDFQAGWCDIHWQRELRSKREHGELDEWVRYANLKDVDIEEGA
jgi:hypothetical protein